MEKMKRLVIILVLVMWSVGFIVTAEAKFGKPYVIDGYPSKGYAVIGTVEEKAVAMINSWPKIPFRLLIEGSADRSGDAANNEEYGSKRANEMKAFLKKKFANIPDADFVVRSLGDQPNARKVEVSADFEVEAMAQFPVKQPSSKDQIISILSLAARFALVIVLLALVTAILLRDRKKRKPAPMNTKPQAAIRDTDDPAVKWVEVENFTVKIESRRADNGKIIWYSPFVGGGGDRLWEEKLSRIKSSVVRCLSPDSKFAGQIPELLKSGDIRKI